jgi:magnesium transporter
MFPGRTLLVELEKKLKRFSKTDLTIYFSDFMDHMNKICDTLDECKEVIEVYKDADYLLGSYRANRVTRILAVIFAIGLPILVVFGLYSMYVILNEGVGKASPQTFFLLLIIVFIIIGAILYFFRRRHFI